MQRLAYNEQLGELIFAKRSYAFVHSPPPMSSSPRRPSAGRAPIVFCRADPRRPRPAYKLCQNGAQPSRARTFPTAELLCDHGEPDD